MDTQVSMPIKIFAAAGLLLALGFGAMTMMKGGSSSSPSAVAPVVTHPAAPVTPAPAATTATQKHPAATAPATHATKPVAHPAKPAAHSTRPAAHAKPAVHPKTTHVTAKPHEPLPAVAADGLPTQLDMLLHIHRVVVVAVYDPEIPTDKLFVGEAQAGARDAHAGFLAVSVLNERLAGPLTAVAGNGQLLPSPGLLVYKQPALLMNIITGFIDRAAVAEAVANALLADAPAQPATTAATTTPAPPAPVTPAPSTTTG